MEFDFISGYAINDDYCFNIKESDKKIRAFEWFGNSEVEFIPDEYDGIEDIICINVKDEGSQIEL